jgi:hypothetical protein
MRRRLCGRQSWSLRQHAAGTHYEPRQAYLPLDEQAYQEDGNGTHDGKNDNDTWLSCGPVLPLHEVLHGDLAARDKRHVDSGHCDGRVF